MPCRAMAKSLAEATMDTDLRVREIFDKKDVVNACNETNVAMYGVYWLVFEQITGLAGADDYLTLRLDTNTFAPRTWQELGLN